nr:ATPase F0 subunit 8 [Travisia sanrikuensis]
MPHLSPLNWALAPIFFWFIISSTMSFLWWSQSLSFPKSLSSSPNLLKPIWPWS